MSHNSTDPHPAYVSSKPLASTIMSVTRSLAQEKKDLTKALYLHLCEDPAGKELTKDELTLVIARLGLTEQFEFDSNGIIKGKKASLCESLRSDLEDVIAIKPAAYGMVPVTSSVAAAAPKAAKAAKVAKTPLLNLDNTKSSIIDDVLVNPARRLAERATAAQNAFIDQLKNLM